MSEPAEPCRLPAPRASDRLAPEARSMTGSYAVTSADAVAMSVRVKDDNAAGGSWEKPRAPAAGGLSLPRGAGG